MAPWMFAIIQGIQVAKEVRKRLKKTPHELRKESMQKFDDAMKKAVKEEDTRELEKWFSGQL